MDDHADLVARATQGDRPSIEALLERHLPGLQMYVRLHAGPLLRRKEDSLDLCQSVCREVLEHGDGFEYRGEGAFRKWLFANALGKIRDRARFYLADKRDAGREATLAGGDGGRADLAALLPSFTSPSQVAMRGEDLELLERAFAELDEDHRQVITLAHVVGLPHAEIAVEMGRSEQATRALLHRALARLGVRMERLRGSVADPAE